MRPLLGLLNHEVPMKTTLEWVPWHLLGSGSSLRVMQINLSFCHSDKSKSGEVQASSGKLEVLRQELVIKFP